MTERLCTRERPAPVARGRDLDGRRGRRHADDRHVPGRRTNYENPHLRREDRWRHGMTTRSASGDFCFGNVKGGLRSPYVDVPTSTWRGTATGASFCFIAGYEIPFDQATLQELYPTHGAYVRAVTRDVHDLVADRFLTRADGQRLIREAGGFWHSWRDTANEDTGLQARHRRKARLQPRTPPTRARPLTALTRRHDGFHSPTPRCALRPLRATATSPRPMHSTAGRAQPGGLRRR